MKRTGKQQKRSPVERMPRDYRDMLALLLQEGVEFLVVGGWAVAVHGHQRATKDLDVFVRASPENAPRVLRALAAFGAPLHGLTQAKLSRPGAILQIGAAFRIDVTTGIDGVDFDEARRDAVFATDGDLEIPVIGRDALIKNKRASDRDVDRRDIRALARVKRR